MFEDVLMTETPVGVRKVYSKNYRLMIHEDVLTGDFFEIS